MRAIDELIKLKTMIDEYEKLRRTEQQALGLRIDEMIEKLKIAECDKELVSRHSHDALLEIIRDAKNNFEWLKNQFGAIL